MNTIKEFENIIKVKFRDKKLLLQSLTHKSFSQSINNEKLEFLGDRVLGFIVSKEIIKVYPNDEEGALDKKYANLVNKSTCYKIGKFLNIKKYIIFGENYRSQKKSDQKIISDTIEALIGAIFQDQGLKEAEKFVIKNWKKYIYNSELTPIDSKSKLQEYSLKTFKQLPKYTLHKKTGPQHDPLFNVEVHIPKAKKMIASGSSKKIAQQKAAKKLLDFLKI